MPTTIKQKGLLIELWTNTDLMLNEVRNSLNRITFASCKNIPSTAKSHCVKSVRIQSYFWSVFSCIRTEYGDLRRFQSEYRKIRTRKTPYLNNFHAVSTSRLRLNFGLCLWLNFSISYYGCCYFKARVIAW